MNFRNKSTTALFFSFEIGFVSPSWSFCCKIIDWISFFFLYCYFISVDFPIFCPFTLLITCSLVIVLWNFHFFFMGFLLNNHPNLSFIAFNDKYSIRFCFITFMSPYTFSFRLILLTMFWDVSTFNTWNKFDFLHLSECWIKHFKILYSLPSSFEINI